MARKRIKGHQRDPRGHIAQHPGQRSVHPVLWLLGVSTLQAHDMHTWYSCWRTCSVQGRALAQLIRLGLSWGDWPLCCPQLLRNGLHTANGWACGRTAHVHSCVHSWCTCAHATRNARTLDGLKSWIQALGEQTKCALYLLAQGSAQREELWATGAAAAKAEAAPEEAAAPAAAAAAALAPVAA